MKEKKSKKSASITFNHDKIAAELSKDTPYKWVIEKGLSTSKPGKRMIEFLEIIGIVTVDYK